MDNYNLQRSKRTKYFVVALIATVLALGVIMLGAYTRLSDAGLGCPDWPGCYGKMVLPKAQAALAQAQNVFPGNPIVAVKAWTEMIHRYFAGTLGLLILGLLIGAVVRRRHNRQQPVFVPLLLGVMVIFQAALGMWTVTLKLLPLIVTAHLLGGMTIIALLWWLTLSSRHKLAPPNFELRALKPWAVAALVIVAGQIFLGAWTSTHYAALACPNFPFCQGSLMPANMDWRNAFSFTTPIGPNYEGGHLPMNARVTIQMAHRYGAFITTAYIVPFALCLIFMRRLRPLRPIGVIVLLLLLAQVTLGVLNIELTLPMWTAVLHNGVAALLLLSVITVVNKLFKNQEGIRA